MANASWSALQSIEKLPLLVRFNETTYKQEKLWSTIEIPADGNLEENEDKVNSALSRIFFSVGPTQLSTMSLKHLSKKQLFQSRAKGNKD